MREHPDYFMPQQFENPANPEVHRRTTALEILEATDGRLDAFVAGVGTGGTITGVGEVLKAQACRACGSSAWSRRSRRCSRAGGSGPHGIQGIGASFVPGVLNRDVLDEIVAGDATRTRWPWRGGWRARRGCWSGSPPGADVWAACQVAAEMRARADRGDGAAATPASGT